MEKLKWGVPTTDYRCISATKFGVLNYIIFLSRIKSEEKKPRLVQFKKKPIISCQNRGEIKGMRKFWPLCHCPIHNHVTNRSQHPKINMAEILNFIITSNVLNYCISTVAWANKWRSVFSIQNELWVWIPSPWSNKIEQTVHWFENKTLYLLS